MKESGILFLLLLQFLPFSAIFSSFSAMLGFCLEGVVTENGILLRERLKECGSVVWSLGRKKEARMKGSVIIYFISVFFFQLSVIFLLFLSVLVK